MRVWGIGLALLTAALPLRSAFSQDDPSSKRSDAVGWGDTEETAKPVEAESLEEPVPAPRSVTAGINGYLRSDWAMWSRRTDPNRFAKGRQSLDLQLRVRGEQWRLLLGAHLMYDFAYQVDREQYGPATIATYERLVRGRDSYVAVTFDHVELAAGLQRIAFGAGELVSVLDVVNPRDEREPGLTDLADQRLPVLMSRLSTFWKRHRVELIGVHEAYFQLRPPPLGFFSPVRALIQESWLGPLIPYDQIQRGIDYRDNPERWSWASQQAFGRWTFSGEHVDAGLYAGSVIEYPGVLTFAANVVDFTELTRTSGPILLSLEHPRYTMLGASLAKPLGDWLMHAELAVDINRPIQLGFIVQPQTFLDPFTVFAYETRQVVRWLLGVRYAGLKSGVISVEYKQGNKGNVVQDDYGIPPLFPVNPFFLAARWQQAFLSDRLSLEVVGTMIGPRQNPGGFVRFQGSYEIVDNFSVVAGYILYVAGDVPQLLNGYTENDRLFVRFRWDFGTD